MFGGLKRDWQLVPRPFSFHNYVHKKRLGLKFKKKLDFLRVLKNPRSKYLTYKPVSSMHLRLYFGLFFKII